MIQHRRLKRSGFTHVDLIVLIFLAVLLAAYGIFEINGVRCMDNRVKCASNLKQIGNGMILYANENNNHLPRTIYDPSDPTVRAYTGAKSASPFSAGGPLPNDVTAALFLLLRTQDLTSDVFVCPLSNAMPQSTAPGFADVQKVSNFTSDQYLTYSLTNPYPSYAAVEHGFKWTATLPADFAIAADMNPGRKELFGLTTKSTEAQLNFGNSNNHSRAGQNVLFGDWHVEWQATSFAGVSQDNIYGPGGLKNAGTQQEAIDPAVSGNSLMASPVHKNDSVLLPVSSDNSMRVYVEPSLWSRLTTPARLEAYFTFFIRLSVGYFLFWVIRRIIRTIKNGSLEQRRLRAGLCTNCGYDLRASPDRCPECGTIKGNDTQG